MGVHWFFTALAVVFMAVPLVLAWKADGQVRAFQSEAFGHFRKAARNLRFMVWAIFAYYLGVLGGSLAVGDLGAMAQYPMPVEGVVIYVRIGAAIVGYVFTYLVARELYLVTRPEKRPLPGDEVR